MLSLLVSRYVLITKYLGHPEDNGHVGCSFFSHVVGVLPGPEELGVLCDLDVSTCLYFLVSKRGLFDCTLVSLLLMSMCFSWYLLLM